MSTTKEYGWNKSTYGEINHLRMTPPFIRLAHKINIPGGSSVCLYDLRCRRPSIEKLHPCVLHSVEHILIEGFRHFVLESFVIAAPMGCQTGFYIVLIGLLEPNEMVELLEKVFIRSLQLKEVPYQKKSDCGQPDFHDLERAKALIQELLKHKSAWLQILSKTNE